MDYVASAVMQKDVKAVPPTLPITELEELFLQHQVSGFPVVENKKLVGVVSRTDVFAALSPHYDITQLACFESEAPSADATANPNLAATLGELAKNITIADVMSSDVVSVAPNDRLHEVADLMYDKRIHRILVVEDGQVCGIITPFDFVRLYSTDRIGAEGRPIKTKDF